MRPLAQGQFDGTDGGRPVRWAATARSGGVSSPPFDALNLASHVGDDPAAVVENRARAAGLVGVDGDALAVLTAEHGARVVVADGGGELPVADAALTSRPGLALLALAADCAPIVLADADAGVIAVAHCGWRGLVAGVVPAVVTAMRAAGARAIQAVVGPSVCPDCYPVGPECVAQIRDAVSPEVATTACLERDGQWFVDVAGTVRAQLAADGVEVDVLAGCTAQDPELYSHRRDGRTGRHGMIVVR